MTISSTVSSRTAGSSVAMGLAILALIVGAGFLAFSDQGLGTALIVVGVIDLVLIGIYRAAKATSLRLKGNQTS